MRYGVSSALLVDPNQMDLPAILDRVRSGGFRMVELSCPFIEQFRWVADHADELRARLETLQLRAATAHSPCVDLDIAAHCQSDRRRAIDQTIAAIQTFAALGIEYVVIHPNGHRQEGYTTQAARSARILARRSLVELAEVASKHEVKLAVENVQAYGTPRPGCCVEDLLELIDGLGDHVGLCVDSSHARMSGHDPARQLALGADAIFVLHINDTDGDNDPHWIPGRGVIDWDSYHDALETIEFCGPRILELEADPSQIDQVLADGYDVATRWSLRPVVRRNVAPPGRQLHTPT